MSKAGYTRTINPLQFSALEPKRFEDLVRQLLYDFRNWRQLEATGRSGSDDGFDARGWEVQFPNAALEDEEETEQDRIWLIQCKRERQIGPAKLAKYLGEIPEEERRHLHGVIFCAAADFSKVCRDRFRSWCSENGISECYLWGKAELEDALFQPKNDHLLFAYFGLSLQIRRRSDQARLRARTTIKRKLKRAFEKSFNVLIRAADDTDYPYTMGKEEFRWWVFSEPRLTHRGLELNWRRHYAFLEDDRWDCANAVNIDRSSPISDPWRGSHDRSQELDAVSGIWGALPDERKGYVSVTGIISFDDILEVDEVGDDITDLPHIFIRLDSNNVHPFTDCVVDATPDNDLLPDARCEYFPRQYTKPVTSDG
ncbi:hypothetical protein Rleg4DRAFT_4206 [Rhizobium leguminosarum bv. trifolii WSM2297]|uniref:Restriction endonuclease type IV Mrr domain-containing protein n=1 Tax=Rhizobium leguminosarum bv. trifolii WSM2297 TaxID=754762 RepID=J0W9R2_RHILT|nr:restriction endonuclease [Rhizobium leguminosarum]EJC82491.1 hypothetical protein Rleg4DRAFT_4206 [Rhizobium leguminosarum bv. trifolii WSM2297]